MIKLLYTSLATLLVMSCASGPAGDVPLLQIESMLIKNQTRIKVSAVRLLVPVTGNFVSCGNILPGSMCSTTFPGAAYQGNAVEITWSQAGQIYSTGQFVMQVPAEVDMERVAAVHVVIAGPGSAGAVIVQNPE